MRVLRTALGNLALLIILVPAILAADAEELSPGAEESLQCAVDGAKPGTKTMFTNAKGECKCDLAGAKEEGGWTKCPSPSTDVENGFAVCTKGAGCSAQCFHNAELQGGECKPYPVAPSSGMITRTDGDCKTGANKVIGAYPSGPCMCHTPTWIKDGGGTVCKEAVPENSFATCLRSSLEVGDSHCGFQCKPGFEKSADGKSCVGETEKDADKKPGDKEKGDTGGKGAGLAPDCPDPFVISYSSATKPCGCSSSMKMAGKRQPDPVQCLPPRKDGKAGCKNVSPGSQCSVACDEGFKATEDEKDCVPARVDVTISELDCGADAGSVGFLSADPVLGCVCLPTKTDKYCGVAVGDPDAEMMCSDTTDKKGAREVKCAVKCSEGFVAKDPSTCEEEEIEGDSVTMAGTATPRDSEELVACAGPDKVFKLPGKRGCKCAASAPTGATECPGVGPLEYAICQYEKGSGDEASCATECVKGKFKKGSPPTCK